MSDRSNPKPSGISVRDAYENIRDWYQANAPSSQNPHAQAALPLIQALAPADQMTDLEIRTVLSEVIMGKLEWAYHESDGKYKMAAYAQAALDTAGLSFVLSPAEKKAIKGSHSALLPHLSEHILRE